MSYPVDSTYNNREDIAIGCRLANFSIISGWINTFTGRVGFSLSRSPRGSWGYRIWIGIEMD